MNTGKRLSKQRGLVPSIVTVLVNGLAILTIATLASCSTSPASLSTSESSAPASTSEITASPPDSETPAPPSPTEVPALSARLSDTVGVVEVQNGAQGPFNQVNNGFLLNTLMQLQTKVESRVRLDLSTGSIVRVGPLTIFSLGTQKPAPAGGLLSQIELQAGKIWIILNGGSLDVNTSSGLASVRGSYMFVWQDPDTHTITVMCLEGTCEYTNAAGTVELTAGQKIVSSDPNSLPPIEPMDWGDLENWLNNAPEAAAMVNQISSSLNIYPPTNPTQEHQEKDKDNQPHGGG